MKISLNRIRFHGNFTLRNLIYTGKSFYISDFEWEQEVPFTERRFKRSALVDVVAMLSCFFDVGMQGIELLSKKGTIAEICAQNFFLMPSVGELGWDQHSCAPI